MPYIKQSERDMFKWVEEMHPLTVGQLNYCISKLCHNYLNQRGMKNYADYNAVIGALECAKLELYRTETSPYEDKKRADNGKV